MRGNLGEVRVKRFKYLVVGGGVAADSAIKGIRLTDKAGSIGLVSDEADPPYNRPPLSKSLWDGMQIDRIWRATRGRVVELCLGRRVVNIDRDRKIARDDRGELYAYEKLLIATGGRARRLPGEDGGVVYFRTLADYRQVRAVSVSSNPICVVGGGLVGTEIAAGVRKSGAAVSLLCSRLGPCSSFLPPELVDRLEYSLGEVGVAVRRVGRVEWVRTSANGHTLICDTGENVAARHVIAGIGLDPNRELAEGAGLAVGRGIRVGEYCNTEDPAVFAAGDVIEYFCRDLDRWVGAEHEENANVSGLCAGRAMAGKSMSYDALPYFYSQVAGCSYEGIGLISNSFRLVLDNRSGAAASICYYLENDRPVGVLFWDCTPDIEAAQELIRGGKSFPGNTVLGALSRH